MIRPSKELILPMPEKENKKEVQKIRKVSSEPIKVKVIYGDGDLIDCMTSVMRIHKTK